jgi:tetratricopeptide (TPR) repeat protein
MHILLCGSLLATPSALLLEGNKAYAAGDYSTAISRYAEVEEEGYYSFALFFNRGNAHFQREEWGRAILYYERALRIRPGNLESVENLQKTQLKLEDNFPFVSLPSFLDAGKRIPAAFSPLGWVTAALLIIWLVMAVVLFFRFRGRELRKRRGIQLMIGAVLLGGLFCGLGAWRQYQLLRTDFAVLLAGETPLRQGPDELSPEIGLLYEGNKVQLLEELGEWRQVMLGDGRCGWAPASSLENISWK